MYVHVYILMRTNIYTRTHMHECICSYLSRAHAAVVLHQCARLKCLYLFMIHIRIFMIYIYIFIYIHIYTYTYICMMYVYVHMRRRTNMYSRTPTHITWQNMERGIYLHILCACTHTIYLRLRLLYVPLIYICLTCKRHVHTYSMCAYTNDIYKYAPLICASCIYVIHVTGTHLHILSVPCVRTNVIYISMWQLLYVPHMYICFAC